MIEELNEEIVEDLPVDIPEYILQDDEDWQEIADLRSYDR